MTDTKYLDDFITWLCGLSKPATHRDEKKQFIELHANPDTLGSAEYILEVDLEEGTVLKEDKLAPEYNSEKYEINFDNHVLYQVQYKVENSYLELEEPYFNSNKDGILEEWINKIESAHQNTSSYKYFSKFQGYTESLKLLLLELRRIKSKQRGSKQVRTDTNKKKPHNYKGELTDECIKKLREYRNNKPKYGVNSFFKEAHQKFKCCRHCIKVTDEGAKIEEISWSTLRSRVKENYPEIYKSKK